FDGMPEQDMSNIFICFIDNRKGTASLEYGLIAAGIAIAVLASIQSIGIELTEIYNVILNGIRSISS
ncbi:MAG: Flp family type IVb pilin, partial [Alphaproteobacteria bacterium]